MKKNSKEISTYLSVLSRLRSVHPNGTELTLKFADRESMESFRQLAINTLLTDNQCTDIPAETGTPDQYFAEEELTGKNLSCRARILCRQPLFWRFLACNLNTDINTLDERSSRQYIYDTCKIETRRELDNNEVAASRYHMLIEKPFLVWLKHSRFHAA